MNIQNFYFKNNGPLDLQMTSLIQLPDDDNHKTYIYVALFPLFPHLLAMKR